MARGGDVCEILLLTDYRAFKQRRTRAGGGLGDAWAERQLPWVVLVCQVRGRLSVSLSRGSLTTGGCQHLLFLAWGGTGPRARQPVRAVRGELPVACPGVPPSRTPLDVLQAGGPAASVPAPPPTPVPRPLSLLAPPSLSKLSTCPPGCEVRKPVSPKPNPTSDAGFKFGSPKTTHRFDTLLKGLQLYSRLWLIPVRGHRLKSAEEEVQVVLVQGVDHVQA